MKTLMSEGSSAEQFVWIAGLANNLYYDDPCYAPSSVTLLKSVLNDRPMDEHFIAEVLHRVYFAFTDYHLFPLVEDHLKYGGFKLGYFKTREEAKEMVTNNIDCLIHLIDEEPASFVIPQWLMRHKHRIGCPITYGKIVGRQEADNAANRFVGPRKAA